MSLAEIRNLFDYEVRPSTLSDWIVCGLVMVLAVVLIVFAAWFDWTTRGR